MSTSKVKLRPAVHCAPVDDGVYVAGWSDSFVVKGPPSLFKFVEAIAPALEQGVVEDELLQSLPDGAPRRIASQLLEELRSRDMLLVSDALTVREVPAPLGEEFAETIAHLEAVSTDPYADFLRLHDARVVVVGSGDGLARAADALSRMGLTHTTVGGEITPDVDLVVHVEPRADRAPLAAVASAAAAAGVPLVQAVATGSAGIVCDGDAARFSLVDVLERFADRASRGFDVPYLAGDPSPLTSALVGNLAAHRAFERLTAVATPARGGLPTVAMVDADTLRVTQHPFVPTSQATVIAPSRASEDKDEGDGASVTVEGDVDVEAAVDKVLEGAHDVADGAVGLFGEPSVRDLSQSPVFATSIRLGPSREALGFGFSEGESRFRAVVEAVRDVLPVLDHDTAGIASVGLDADAFVLDGIARHFLGEWVGRGCDGRPLAYGDMDDAVSHMCWKSLALRFDRDISVVTARPLPTADLWLGAVLERGAVVSACYATSAAQAARNALTAMVGMVQTGRDGGIRSHLGGWPQGPPIYGLFDGDEPAKPAEVLATVEAALDAGTTVSVHRIDHPLLAHLGLVAGWVAVSNAGVTR